MKVHEDVSQACSFRLRSHDPPCGEPTRAVLTWTGPGHAPTVVYSVCGQHDQVLRVMLGYPSRVQDVGDWLASEVMDA